MISIFSEKVVGYRDGLPVVRVEFSVDTAEELPEMNDFSGKILGQGSIAWDVSTGDFYGLTSFGEWVNQMQR